MTPSVLKRKPEVSTLLARVLPVSQMTAMDQGWFLVLPFPCGFPQSREP